jgi:hypothetical protein
MPRLVDIALGLGLMGTAVVAAAAPSPAPVCADGGDLQRVHETAHRQGVALVESAWAALDRDCGQRARLERTVKAALDRRSAPAGSSESSRCRDSGFRAGAQAALAHVAAACTGK